MAPFWEGKKYKLVKSENFDGFLKGQGVGWLLSKMTVAAWKPGFELIKESDTKYIIRYPWLFNLDIPFTIDKKRNDSLAFENENKLVQNSIDGSVFILEFTETGLTEVCSL